MAPTQNRLPCALVEEVEGGLNDIKTALRSDKESVQSVTMTMSMQPFGQSQSKVTAVSGNVDQSKPDVHFKSHINRYIS